MKTSEEACRQYAETAFEIGIKNCIQKPAPGEKRRQVKISEMDSQTMYAFYRQYVKDDRDSALLAIGRASRKAAGQSPILAVGVFVVALMFVLLVAFHSLWPILAAAFGGILVLYTYWKRRRTAQKIWANRKALKGGTREALEKMCLFMALPVYRAVSLPVIGGLSAAMLICIYQTVMLFV